MITFCILSQILRLKRKTLSDGRELLLTKKR